MYFISWTSSNKVIKVDVVAYNFVSSLELFAFFGISDFKV
jgi:hypothetical protein